MTKPRRVHGIRSGGRREGDLRRPDAGVRGFECQKALVLLTMPMFRSTVAIRLFAPALSSLLVTSFSSASTTPSLHRMPTAVPPFSTALTAYSTWFCERGRRRGACNTEAGVPGSCGRRARRPNWTSRSLCLWTSIEAVSRRNKTAAWTGLTMSVTVVVTGVLEGEVEERRRSEAGLKQQCSQSYSGGE